MFPCSGALTNFSAASYSYSADAEGNNLDAEQGTEPCHLSVCSCTLRHALLGNVNPQSRMLCF